MLAPFEKVMADKGYKGDPRIHTPLDAKDLFHYESMGKARARHETINRRFKQFGMLSKCFRHHRDLHTYGFNTAVAIVELEIETGHPSFETPEHEDELDF